MRQTRREFLEFALTAGAAAAFAKPSAVPAKTAADGLPRRILGRTKESVTIFGLGCAYMGSGVSEAETRAIVEAALEGGVRYFDAAPEYEHAEERLAPVIGPVRDRVFVVSKTYSLDAKGAEGDLTTALKQLKTDRVDLFLQHAVGIKPISTNRQILGKGGSLEFLRKAKKQGLTRFIGMSVHPPHAPALHLLNESDEWDVVMPFMNYVARAQEREDAKCEDLLARAHRANLGMVGMKLLGGYPGRMAEDYDRTFRYALSVPGVACVLIGVRNVREVRRAVRAAKEFRPLSETEMKETLRMGEEAARSRSPEATILTRHTEGDFGSLPWA